MVPRAAQGLEGEPDESHQEGKNVSEIGYPDLVVHRVLRSALRRTLTPAKKARWLETFSAVAEHTSEMERKAEAAEGSSPGTTWPN